MHNMMGSTYLEVDGASMSRGGHSWMGGLGGTALSYPGLDAGAYADDSPVSPHGTPLEDVEHD